MDRVTALRALETKVAAGDGDGEQLTYLAFAGELTAAFCVLQAHNGSLDAAKALHEVVLPGWDWALSCSVCDIWPEGRPADGASANSIDPARAWLIAIIRALIAMEDSPLEGDEVALANLGEM